MYKQKTYFNRKSYTGINKTASRKMVDYCRNLIKVLKNVLLKVFFGVFDLIEAILGMSDNRYKNKGKPSGQWKDGNQARTRDHTPWNHKKGSRKQIFTEEGNELINIIKKTKDRDVNKKNSFGKKDIKLKECLIDAEDFEKQIDKTMMVANYLENNLNTGIDGIDFESQINNEQIHININVNFDVNIADKTVLYQKQLLVNYINKKIVNSSKQRDVMQLDQSIGAQLTRTEEKLLVVSMEKNCVRIDKINMQVIESINDSGSMFKLAVMDVMKNIDITPLFAVRNNGNIIETIMLIFEEQSHRYIFNAIGGERKHIEKLFKKSFKTVNISIQKYKENDLDK